MQKLLEEIWPNFFIVGGSRCGTTSLYSYLKVIPKIFVPEWKAPAYFFSNKTIDKETYLNLFKDVKDKKAIGESSGYLQSPESPGLIHEQLPNSKIIISLRDPIERTFSHYLQGLGGGYYTGTFEEAFSIFMSNDTTDSKYEIMKHMIDGSYYYKSVKRYLETFGKKQIKIIIFEEYIADTKRKIKEILDFLDIDDDVPKNIEKVYNPYRQPLGKVGTSLVKNETVKNLVKSLLPDTSAKTLLKFVTGKSGKKPVLGENERNEMKKLFTDDVKKLEGLLNRTFPWSVP